MDFKDYVRMQLAEALGEVNRYYCSQHFGYAVTDSEMLIRYYIRQGGAADFARRWKQLSRQVEMAYRSVQQQN